MTRSPPDATCTAQPPRPVVAAACGVFVAAMVGVAYAAVPLYDWFCRATGFGGTTQVATAGARHVLDRTVTVRFDANVGGGLPWRFEPEQTSIEVEVGEVVTVNYTVVNLSARETAGAGVLQRLAADSRRLLLEDQLLLLHRAAVKAGENARDAGRVLRRSRDRRRMPSGDDLNTITLSYTFYPLRAAERPRGGQRSTPGRI